MSQPIYYYWFNVRLLSEASPEQFLAYWQPLSMDVATKGVLTSILFTSHKHPQTFYTWKETVGWYALGWMNECMAYPASLGYVHTLESFNAFVSMYGGRGQQL